MSAVSSGSPVPGGTDLSQTLQGLQSFEDFQRANASAFPSESSLRWFYRVNSTELLDAGAVVRFAGRILINPGAFVPMALTIGRRAARGRVKAVSL
jgi:hypothetical protein